MEGTGDVEERGPSGNPSSLKAIGELLRQVREAKGVTIAQAQMETKIRTKYLEALENGDDSAAPGEAYFKGFLRFYANYLGLDGTALVSRYKELKAGERGGAAQPAREIPPASGGWPTARSRRATRLGRVKSASPEDSSSAPREVGSRRERQGRRRTGQRRFPFFVLMVLLVVAVGVFAVAFIRGQRTPAAWESEPNGLAAGEGQPGGTGVGTGGSGTAAGGGSAAGPPASPDFAQLVVRTTSVDRETTSYVLKGQTLVVEVSAVERCWVRTIVDERVVFEGTLEPGQEMSWTAGKKLSVRFGNPGGVRLKVNSAIVDTGPVEQPARTMEFEVGG